MPFSFWWVPVGAVVGMWWAISCFCEDDEIIVVSEFLASLLAVFKISILPALVLA